MKTPETKAGRLTELVMARVRGKLPELPTHEYNRVYECVLAELVDIDTFLARFGTVIRKGTMNMEEACKDEELKRWREKWGEGSTIHELSEIINTARERGLQIHGSEIKWLLELPMTEEEYQRFCALTGWWGRVKL